MSQSNGSTTITTTTTQSTVTKPKRQRNRTPKSCLQCSKRKIYCSKERPACSNCVKYAVGHLCSYTLPPWADANNKENNSASQQQPQPPQQCPMNQNQQTTTIKVQQTSEYKQLKQENEKIIQSQRKEIDDLKRQLSVLQQLSPREPINQQQSIASIGCTTITILNKISPLASTYLSSRIEMLNDYSLKIIFNSNMSNKSTYIDTYSWINLIKLDPQLTTLWYKITNLQKMYHVYKMNILKDKNINQNHNINKQRQQSELEQVCERPKKKAKKSNYKINEVDFTYSLQPSANLKESSTPPTNEEHRCPVIECDFNFMTEEQNLNTPSPFRASPSTQIVKSEAAAATPEIDQKSRISYTDSLNQKILTLWNSLINLPRGESKLNIQQIHFLLDYYYNKKIESREILSFYRFDIQAVFKKTFNDEVELNLPQQNKEPNYKSKLKSLGIFLCMLAVIIEETLSEVKEIVKQGIEKDLCLQFEEIFPNEMTLLGLGVKQNNLLYIVQEILINFENEENSNEEDRSLSYCAVIVSLLNREIDDYKKPGSSISDTKNSFTSIFTNFLHILLDSPLEIWKDPELVELKSQYKKRKKDLKLHFCYLWTNIIRLTNLVMLNFVPFVKHSEYLDGLLHRMYIKIEQVDSLQYHLMYLTKVEENDLIVMLHVHYLIGNISCALHQGILNLGTNKLTVHNLQLLIKQCQTWISDAGVQRLIEIRKFEVLIILDYLSYFMTYISMLQGEELNDKVLIGSVVPEIFTKLLTLIKQLKVNPNRHSQYMYSIVTEVLTRSIQFVVGLISRVREDNKQQDPSLLKQVSGNVMLNNRLVTPIEFMNHVTNEVNEIIAFLTNVLINKERLFKLTKLWKFYITLTKDLSYANIHASLPEFKNNTSTAVCPVLSSESSSSEGLINNFTKESSSNPSSLPKMTCPVMHNNLPLSSTSTMSQNTPNTVVSSISKNSKCPISHITTPMNNDEEIKLSNFPPALQPFNHHKGSIHSQSPLSPSSSSNHKKVKKCPFDHTAMMRPNLYPNHIESSIRGNNFNQDYNSKTHSPSPLSNSYANTPPILPPQPLQSINKNLNSATVMNTPPIMNPINQPQPTNNLTNDSLLTSSSNINLNFDDNLDVLNQFNEFDFDFLNQENFIEHFNNINGDFGFNSNFIGQNLNSNGGSNDGFDTSGGINNIEGYFQ
ncbi:uncharacterized protein KGF55_002244 [Candida pseudojiufengensis]|uniref:uncharacterized protein n=1 Tax=Candida pseudojiufengensis TaxID=497109 RepID=UPI0022244F9F|nr:uncharacterized protein KGF55_002244 [Candida pseudojiufengensis]KAI5964302.1 hypothetical protein KGF55_002244 [Candida pseudojiufengensis]